MCFNHSQKNAENANMLLLSRCRNKRHGHQQWDSSFNLEELRESWKHQDTAFPLPPFQQYSQLLRHLVKTTTLANCCHVPVFPSRQKLRVELKEINPIHVRLVKWQLHKCKPKLGSLWITPVYASKLKAPPEQLEREHETEHQTSMTVKSIELL